MNSQPNFQIQITQIGGSMVSIGTHKLFISVTGSRSSPQDPVVIIIPGAGDVASSYPVLKRLLQPFTQILLYDRSGLGQSEKGPHRPTAIQSAKELHALLAAVKISPPLLLVAHSYGGIIAREYLHLFPQDVSGMVLCDAATERNHEFFRVPDPNIHAVLGNLRYAQVTGLREESKLSRDELRTRAIDIARGVETSHSETEGYLEVCQSLGSKEQVRNRAMGDKPLSVIHANSARDYRRIYEAGVKAGNGTEEQREAFWKLLENWDEISKELQEEQLGLSSNSRLVCLEDCGHHVHLVRPDVLAEEIRWVKDQILESSKGNMRL
ncbi:Alpha beta hydrolase [Aspergillus sclerotialis]|uniref:Alpha beta hydrolase n=1 Tax=Aspergillus sclerotialis TaxID=2070753 RepID=A0A3A2Z587_9EURO|nr:Alpha beta hydrolase [Aspergillus sclerotialis]